MILVGAYDATIGIRKVPVLEHDFQKINGLLAKMAEILDALSGADHWITFFFSRFSIDGCPFSNLVCPQEINTRVIWKDTRFDPLSINFYLTITKRVGVEVQLPIILYAGGMWGRCIELLKSRSSMVPSGCLRT